MIETDVLEIVKGREFDVNERFENEGMDVFSRSDNKGPPPQYRS